MTKLNAVLLRPDQFNMWNSFVDESPQGDVFCYSWWLDVITKSNFKIYAVFHKDTIIAGMPLALDENRKVNEPPLTRTLGVLYKDQAYLSLQKQISNQRRWLSALLNFLPLNEFVQMSMHHNFTDWLLFRWKGFSQTTRYTYLIDYNDEKYKDLYKNLNRGRKESIKKAKKSGIHIEQTDDIALMYKYESMSFQRQGLNFKMSFNELVLLDKQIKKNIERVVFKATDNMNRIHAMVYVVFNKRSAYALLSGGNPVFRKSGGHTLAMWEAMKYFKDKVDIFNFGGSDLESIERHLKGFGGVLTPYFHIYNEKQLWSRNNIWYHLDRIKFHSSLVVTILIKKANRLFSMKKI